MWVDDSDDIMQVFVLANSIVFMTNKEIAWDLLVKGSVKCFI